MLTALAPAKINLVLEVLGRRNDGYHEILSIFHAIDLCDILVFELDEGISLRSGEPSLEFEDNLVVKAARLLKETTGCRRGVRIKLEKRIPRGVGLGGGSSDAASTLCELNQLWELRLPTSELAKLASKLGSDVSFFVYGGTALMGGRGEKLIQLITHPLTYFVLLIPPLPGMPQKTRQAYTNLRVDHFTKRQFIARALGSLVQHKCINYSFLFNVFEGVAFEFFPGLNEYWERFRQAGAASVHLAGSGPTLFTMFSSEQEARELYQRLQNWGLESYLVRSFSADKANKFEFMKDK